MISRYVIAVSHHNYGHTFYKIFDTITRKFLPEYEFSLLTRQKQITPDRLITYVMEMNREWTHSLYNLGLFISQYQLPLIYF